MIASVVAYVSYADFKFNGVISVGRIVLITFITWSGYSSISLVAIVHKLTFLLQVRGSKPSSGFHSRIAGEVNCN